MLGAIIGDYVGSRFEFSSFKSKSFDLFGNDQLADGKCTFTDDSVMTIAVADACMQFTGMPDDAAFKQVLIEKMHYYGRKHQDAGYGFRFYFWIKMGWSEPLNSFGNGSAMRVAPVGWVCDTLEETEHLAKLSAEVTHNHPEGIKGAQAVAAAIWMGRNVKSKEEIRRYIEEKYYPDCFRRTLDEIRPDYKFDETCQGTVPVAFVAFWEAKDFEDAIRNAISVGGDADTLADITGAIAEAFYGVPAELSQHVLAAVDPEMREIAEAFAQRYYPKRID